MLSKNQFGALYVAPMFVFLLVQVGMGMHYGLDAVAITSSFGLWWPVLESYNYASSPASVGGSLVLPSERSILMVPILLFLCGVGLYIWYASGVWRRFTGWPQRIGCLAVAVVPHAILLAIVLNAVSSEKKVAPDLKE